MHLVFIADISFFSEDTGDTKKGQPPSVLTAVHSTYVAAEAEHLQQEVSMRMPRGESTLIVHFCRTAVAGTNGSGK